MTPVRIVIFAKAPLAGFAKTRLIPALGAQGAADLAHRLLTFCVHQALKAKVGPVELCVTPAAIDPIWRSLRIPNAVRWSDQGEGDLGERMAHAAKRVIEDGESILLIGTDCPSLDSRQLQQAVEALHNLDATLVPTYDGGYALLGLKHFDVSLFAEMVWSTNTVASETLNRMQQLGWSVQSLGMLHDIDEPEDLQWLPETWLETIKFSPSSLMKL